MGRENKPELVVEVAASSAAIDLYDKKRAYRRNGGREYIVWRTVESQLDWFVLKADEYVCQLPDEQSIIRSKIFPGLRLALRVRQFPTAGNPPSGLVSPFPRCYQEK